MIFTNNLEKHQVESEKNVETDNKKELILYNDNVNTFDFVIEALIELCDHDPIQAEQCAFITHYKGKCPVKSGSYEELKPVCAEMLKRGLTVEIE
ncbi:MAG: ATP-dependent Clp protease adaptor ClpS [Bacteroidetes bacterium]|nr:MAG: ATP-dependent Clp protease adaptor ClpS [Bacteroidota bacterium]